jgi:hypothetical protein
MKVLPPLGEDPSHRSGDPLDLGSSGGDDTSKQELGDRVGVCLCVGKGECGSPRSSPDEPPVDVKGGSQLFDVCDQMLSGVR